ncbi:MAG: polymer-forming cytoskeletal protein [Blastocatellia bacterium]|nr:polymer-forming cytoskeletal protein [Blastocatellia bacterium]
MRFGKSAPVEHGGLILGDTEIRGEISFKDLISIEGRVIGHIQSDNGRLILAEKGKVEGDIEVGSASISGEIQGNLFARERIDIHGTGKIMGDITAPVLTVDAGAQISGKVETVAPGTQIRISNKPSIQPAPAKKDDKNDVGGLRATG